MYLHVDVHVGGAWTCVGLNVEARSWRQCLPYGGRRIDFSLNLRLLGWAESSWPMSFKDPRFHPAPTPTPPVKG